MKYTKRILLVCSSLGDGGAERVAVNMSCEVDKYGHKVTIFYWDNKSDREYALSDNVSLIKSPSRSFLGRVIALTKLLRNQSKGRVRKAFGAQLGKSIPFEYGVLGI